MLLGLLLAKLQEEAGLSQEKIIHTRSLQFILQFTFHLFLVKLVVDC